MGQTTCYSQKTQDRWEASFQTQGIQNRKTRTFRTLASKIPKLNNEPHPQYAVLCDTHMQSELDDQLPLKVRQTLIALKSKNAPQRTAKQNSTLGEEGEPLPPYKILKKNVVYLGSWLKGKPHGKGIVYHPDGEYFEGEFLQGKANCQKGLYIYNDGSYYQGGIVNSQANGYGIMNYKGSMMVYEGTWRDDQPDGEGKETFGDGSYYVGSFKEGQKHGRGRFFWKPTGMMYEGQFREGYIQGFGKQIIQTAKGTEVYQGRFSKNKKNSISDQVGQKCRQVTPMGVYEGDFNDDLREGNGKFTWKDGKVFVGEFVKGKPSGPGELSLPNGQVVRGVWKDGENIKIQSIHNNSQHRQSEKK